MRIVLDTNVILSALLYGGQPESILQLRLSGIVQLFTSTAILSELFGVLSREKFAGKIRKTGKTVATHVDSYKQACKLVTPISIPRIAPDPDDDVILGTAVAAEATYLITGDKPFLSVGSYQSVQLITATQFLDVVATPSQTV